MFPGTMRHLVSPIERVGACPTQRNPTELPPLCDRPQLEISSNDYPIDRLCIHRQQGRRV